MGLVILLSSLVVFIMIYMYIQKNSELIYVKSSHNNKEYLVQNFEDKQEAADLISRLVDKLDKLVNSLLEKNPNKKNVIRLKERFNKDNIMENNSNDQYTSYSINKGEQIIFCIRSRDGNNKLIDLNTLMFVALHEMAHLMSESIGHTDEFWNNFKFILKHAEERGLYKNIDYSKNPKKYCGMEITDNPMYHSK